MSKIFKRFAAVLLVLTMVLPLAACKKEDTITAQQVQNTQAVTVGSHTLSAVMLNYFYMDAVTDWYGIYGTSMGLDLSKPLDQQIINETTGKTWADSFLEMAVDNIQSTYALYDLAMAENFTLSKEDQQDLDMVVADLEELIAYYTKLYSSNGQTYPYTNATDYLESVYGLGSNPENYKEYNRVCTIANAYYEAYGKSLSYTGLQLREYEKDKMVHYNSYSFSVYYLSISDFDSVEDAKAVADQLAAGSYTDKAAFDEAIKSLPMNADIKKPEVSEGYQDVLYSQIINDYVQWLADETRKSGDMTVIARTSSDKVNTYGYYVVRFESVNDNKFLTPSIRHVFIAFQDGILNTNTGETTYTEKAKAEAKLKAETLLMEYRAGTMNEMRFADIATNHSDELDAPEGGLYETLLPGVLADAVESWSCDPVRKPGDTTLVESEKGWHLIYFVKPSMTTYRDQLLTEDLRAADVEAWYKALVEATKAELLDATYVNRSLVLLK